MTVVRSTSIYRILEWLLDDAVEQEITRYLTNAIQTFTFQLYSAKATVILITQNHLLLCVTCNANIIESISEF